MMPPPDRINYAEMKVQKIQIPVQVAVLKPVYVDCPYPSYVFVQGESQAKLLERQYGNWRQFLNTPQIRQEILNVFSDTESDSEEEKKKKKKKGKSSKAKIKNEQNNAKELIQNQQQIPQYQNQNQQSIQTYSQADQNNIYNQIKPPIVLDDRGANFEKQNVFPNTLQRNQTQSFPTANILQTRNELIPNNSSNVSRGRQDLQNYKTFLQKSQQNLPLGEAGKSRYEFQNN
ncbi:unnamed protein product [Paramecium sonneborni]|uniref:Uncharacterized protein n=1 Tax=Paramecium sonneborni TaxID=65129 RepID=A0A8S1PS93_9CILI|nr:unnamed protein product [Paramecium sonneborni]